MNGVFQEILRHKNVGIADDHDLVLYLSFELDQGRNLRIRAKRFRANDQLRIDFWIFRTKLAHQLADRIVVVGHAKKNLQWRFVILAEPTLQAAFCLAVGALEGLEQRDGGLKFFIRHPAVERETQRSEPLPERKATAQNRQRT